MKKFSFRIFLAVALVLGLGGVAVVNNGCTSTSTQNAVKVEYQTLSAVVNVVDVARGAYDALYKAGKVPQHLDDQVAKVYLQYQQAGNIAISAAKLQATLVAQPNVSAPVIDNTANIAAFETIVNELLALFGQTPGLSGTPVVTPLKISRKAKV